MTPEFSRPHRLDRIGAGESDVHVAAQGEELKAIARRFGLPAVEKLEASYRLRREALGVLARGHLSAQVTQSCVATGVPLPARIEEDFAIRFLPEPGADDAPEEVELDESECDTVFYSGNAIDLGEAAAETLALALDPFPRSPDAEDALKQAGVLGEGEVGPFSGLAALKDRLTKGQG
ncbi:YceD family protein [Sphingomonas sp. M1-B02]|uniref:YceD family protein n=1 Tax=Sphingomonas sp. M1-B02 TaxID=3114300 RepID=UPI00223EAC31|nr:YceD family protein [Sphingomonas sp. S6-11]UZK65004.1 DUF177 domain-containing protein [Sphingomonas sp. S6-11]